MTWVDYECKPCESIQEVKFESLKDITKTQPCKNCGKDMERSYSKPPAVKFIGAGFYVNDYGARNPTR